MDMSMAVSVWETIKAQLPSGLTLYVLQLLFGLACCLFGYSLRRVWAVLGGAALGLCGGMVMMALFTQNVPLIYLVGAVLGVVLAVLAWFAYLLGVFLWAFCLLFMILYNLFPENIYILGVLVSTGVSALLANLVTRYQNTLLLWATAFGGSAMVVWATASRYQLLGQPYLLLTAGLALGLFGLVVQFYLNPHEKRYPPPEKPAATEAEQAAAERERQLAMALAAGETRYARPEAGGWKAVPILEEPFYATAVEPVTMEFSTEKTAKLPDWVGQEVEDESVLRPSAQELGEA